jgi:FixJ family two-component response regulator
MIEVSQRNVAIVDDDQAARDSLRFLLEVVGHPVKAYGSAAEVLSADLPSLRA